MENQTKVIAERLKMARHNAELTVVDMAEAAGVSASEYEPDPPLDDEFPSPK